jgi:hypothetical protein
MTSMNRLFDEEARERLRSHVNRTEGTGKVDRLFREPPTAGHVYMPDGPLFNEFDKIKKEREAILPTFGVWMVTAAFVLLVMMLSTGYLQSKLAPVLTMFETVAAPITPQHSSTGK